MQFCGNHIAGEAPDTLLPQFGWRTRDAVSQNDERHEPVATALTAAANDCRLRDALKLSDQARYFVRKNAIAMHLKHVVFASMQIHVAFGIHMAVVSRANRAPPVVNDRRRLASSAVR